MARRCPLRLHFRWLDTIPFIEVPVHVGLLAPVIVSDLLPDFPGFAADRQEPVLGIAATWNVFNGIPEILALGRVRENTPSLVSAEQLIDAVLLQGTFIVRRL